MQGKFITLEGIDGAGKGEALNSVLNTLKEASVEVIVTREPGGTNVGEAIRDLMLHTDYSISSKTEALLVFAAREQHLHEVIRPCLEQGKWVVCDRFTDSTYAYQGGGRQLGFDNIQQLEEYVHHGFSPSLTLFLDADKETGKKRVTRIANPDRFENEFFDESAESFYDRVRKAFLQIAENDPKRVKIINANRPLSEVASACRNYVLELLKSTEA